MDINSSDILERHVTITKVWSPTRLCTTGSSPCGKLTKAYVLGYNITNLCRYITIPTKISSCNSQVDCHPYLALCYRPTRRVSFTPARGLNTAALLRPSFHPTRKSYIKLFRQFIPEILNLPSPARLPPLLVEIDSSSFWTRRCETGSIVHCPPNAGPRATTSP